MICILLNHCQYGDVRIRTHVKAGWQRDVMRVQGRVTGDYAIGDIHVKVVYQSQINHSSSARLFKSVLSGFLIGFDRKILLTGEDE